MKPIVRVVGVARLAEIEIGEADAKRFERLFGSDGPEWPRCEYGVKVRDLGERLRFAVHPQPCDPLLASDDEWSLRSADDHNYVIGRLVRRRRLSEVDRAEQHDVDPG